MDSGRQFKTKGSWREVNLKGVDLSTFDDNAFSNLISMQELTDYDIVGRESHSSKAKKRSQKEKMTLKKSADSNEKDRVKKKKKKKVKGNALTIEKTDIKNGESDSEDMNTPVEKVVVKKKKRKKTVEDEAKIKSASGGGRCGKRKAEPSAGERPAKKSKRERNKEKVVEIEGNETEIVQEKLGSNEMTEHDLPGWKGMFVPGPVLKSLNELGFTAPTPIQALTLPSAIRDRLDIVGAAETGSGKTLAFGIPLIHHILARRAEGAEPSCESLEEEVDDLEEQEEINQEEVEPGSMDLQDSSDEEEIDEESDEEIVEVSEDGIESEDEDDSSSQTERPLYALVLTPTRELAIQVQNHIKNVAKYTDIRVLTLVGGISLEKQRRLLRRRPEIVVATPGRLWELMEEGDPHLAQIPSVPYFVIDECDRMVEKGHFLELSKILELMNNEEEDKKKRQSFVFSATLSFVHDAPNRLKKKKLKKLTPDEKVNDLMARIGIKARAKVVDLTRKTGTAETLTETKIYCSLAEKDVYLYYFLQQYPGRTLVFTNSKDSLRRLLSILTLLNVNPLPLHADMHQKQRLKNLERFTATPGALLLATDVAARGLDIPDVEHVIHFQVPQTAENYIHRSGRTARATKEGLSFMIIGPDDIKNYRKILRSLKRTEDIPQLPIELKYLTGIKERVTLAKSIDQLEHKKSKAQNHNNWFIKTAKEMDLELDEDLLKDTGDSREKSDYKQRIQQLRLELKSLLRTPVIAQSASHQYPTSTGRLVVPYMQTGQAIEHVKKGEARKPDPARLLSKPKNKNRKKKARKT